jgi:hypothetical protein
MRGARPDGGTGTIARGLTVNEAAAYAGCKTQTAFRSWVRKGIMPRPIPGTHRYDRKAIDSALDRMSGLSPTVPEQSAYGAWKQRAGAA